MADVITTCIQVTLNDPTCLQEYSEFKPARNDISLSDLHTRMKEKIKKGQHDFRIYRYRFIEKVLAMVRTENDSVESKRKDIQSVNRICSTCSEIYDTVTFGLKRKCDKCGGQVVKQVNEAATLNSSSVWTDIEKIDIGKKKSGEVRPSIKMAESILKNPNSYENIAHILSKIKTAACSDSRKWIFWVVTGRRTALAKDWQNLIQINTILPILYLDWGIFI